VATTFASITSHVSKYLQPKVHRWWHERRRDNVTATAIHIRWAETLHRHQVARVWWVKRFSGY